jgi:murein tripeptide amidase MpaA
MSIKSKIFFIFLTIILLLGIQLLANSPIVFEQKELVAPDGNIDWTRYYNSDEMLTIMKELERRYPKLAKVYVIGKSYLGKDLHLMEITNHDIKPALEKPGIYIDGNMHTGEQTGAMLTLYMIHHLLTNYGKDAQATRLVDTCTFYLRPKFEVDASDWWLAHPGDTDYGGSVRPRDNDLDGEADEDSPDDLNGDGQITKMRIKDPDGEWKISDKDTRVMEKRKENETGGTYYRILSEGIDNDGDGLFNEDGIGGINLSHNFSWGNRNREQIQSSPYTFSEPETRATVEFWEKHPNIYVMVDLHTYGSFDELLYFPGGEDMPAKDMAAYKYLSAAYAHFTNREEVLPMMKTFPQPIWKLGMGDPEPFAYYNMGMFGWCEELWGGDYANPALRKYDKNKDKKITEDEILDFLDKEVEGRGFVEWKPFNHPQLGLVEIGGLVEKFTVQNPPQKLLEKELKFKLPWYLYLAETAPRVKIRDVKVNHLDGKAVSLKVIVENVGFLPTNVTEWAVKVGLAKPVVVKLELKNAVLLEGKEKISLGNITGNQDRGEKAEWGVLPASEGFPDNKRDARWIIKMTGENAEAIVTVISEKAGTDSKKIPLK